MVILINLESMEYIRNNLTSKPSYIVRKTVLYILLILIVSCATKKHQLATIMTDVNSGKELSKRSIELERGKICYISTAKYESQPLDNNIFKDKNNSYFIFSNLSMTSFWGGASSSHKIDTIITNRLMDEIVLEEVIRNSPQGFEFQFVQQEEFANDSGELSIDLLYTKYKPNLIINLSQYSLKISGEANRGTSVVSSKPMMEMPGIYSSTTTHTNFYGYILMDYTINWEIIQTMDNQISNIHQSGRFISKNSKRYDLREEIINSAQKAGREFSQLFTVLK